MLRQINPKNINKKIGKQFETYKNKNGEWPKRTLKGPQKCHKSATNGNLPLLEQNKKATESKYFKYKSAHYKGQ